MSKHTPGPWRVAVQSGDVSPSEAEATARLIAAAPKMLEALQAILERSQIGSRIEEIAETALAEATGIEHNSVPEVRS